jgi:hypothetical protein
MQKWMRTGVVALGVTGAMIGGGTMVAHAQTSDTSGSSSSSTSDSGSTSTTAPSGSATTPAAGAQGNCPNM